MNGGRRRRRLLETVFVEPTRAFAKSLQRRPGATAFLTLERAFERVKGKVTADQVGAAFAEIMDVLRNDPTAIRPPKLPLPSTDRRRELCALFDQLDAAYPAATAIMLAGSGGVGHDRLVTDTRTWRLDERAAKLRGEHRSEALQELARHGLEQTYGWFNRMVLQAHWALRGEQFNYNLKFGTEVIRVTQLQLIPSGTLPTAAKLRNAAAHGHWNYDPKTGQVTVRDKSGWQDTLTPAALQRQIRRALVSAADLQWILSRSAVHHLIGGLAPAFKLMVHGATQAEIDRAAEPVARQHVAAYSYLKGLGWQDAPP